MNDPGNKDFTMEQFVMPRLEMLQARGASLLFVVNLFSRLFPALLLLAGHSSSMIRRTLKQGGDRRQTTRLL